MAHYNEGLYLCEITTTALQLSKGGKQRADGTVTQPAPMIVIRFKVLERIDTTRPDRPYIPVDAQYERTVYMLVPEKPEDQDKLVARLRYAGWTGMRFEELETLETKHAQFWVKHKDGEYNGKATVNEEWSLALPQRESKPLNDDPRLAKKLNALLGGKLKAAMPVAPQPHWAPEPETVPPAGEPFTPNEDDDVPF
jgi:hypothetical protein